MVTKTAADLSVTTDDNQAVAIYDTTSTVGGQTQTDRYVRAGPVSENGGRP